MRYRCRLAALGVALSAAACGGGDGVFEPPPNESPVGVYTLQSINGQPLPFLWIEVGADKLEITAGLVILEDNMNFSDATTFRITESGVVTTEEDVYTGTWSRGGNTITFNGLDGGSYIMSFDGTKRLTQSVEGLTLVYQK